MKASPVFWLASMADGEIPTRVGQGIRTAAWVSLPFIFLLLAGERALDGNYLQAIGCLVLFPVSVLVVVKWETVWQFAGRYKAMLLYVVVAIIGALIVGYCLAKLVAGQAASIPSQTGRVVWNFDQAARGEAIFLNSWVRPGEERRVAGFGFHGRNTSADPIVRFSGYVRSDLTNAELPFYILAQDSANADRPKLPFQPPFIPTKPDETYGIPGLAEFDISTFEKSTMMIGVDGIPLSKFLRDFGAFTVFVTYDNRTYSKSFTREDVKRQIDLLDRSADPSKNTLPRVTRRPDAAAPVQSQLPLPPPAPPIGKGNGN